MAVRTSHFSRVVQAGAVALLVTGTLYAAPAAADHRVYSTLMRAADAVGAAIAWSQARFPETAETVLLANDTVFADALAGGLAQGTLNAPLLLTAGEELDERVRAELQRLKATKVHLLGGTSALSEEVEQALTDMSLAPERHSGATRVETAVALATAHAPEAPMALVARAFGEGGGDPTRAWADSLAAGALSAQAGHPLLLTATDKLPASVSAYLDQAKITGVMVIGGASAVSEAVAAELAALGVRVERVAGPNRAGTAVAIAGKRGMAEGQGERLLLVDGQREDAWAAGLTAAGYAAAMKAPLLLASGGELAPESQKFLTAATVDAETGTAAPPLDCGPLVEVSACDAAAAALGHDVLHENEVFSDAPELVRAAFGERADGAVQVRYVFDEAVRIGTAGASRFRLAPPNTSTASAAQSVALDPEDNTVVIATFAAGQAVDTATLALADAGAVTDPQDVAGLDGGAELSDAVRAPGRTTRPDLIAAEPLSGGVLLTFDQPADTVIGRNVGVVLDDGRVFQGGNATLEQAGTVARVTVEGLPPERARRVVARQGAVMTRQGPNPFAVVDVADGGTTATPDLVSVTLSARNHSVVLTFDQPVKPLNEGGDPVLFRLRYEDGTETTSASTTERTGPMTVTARFPENAVNKTLAGVGVGAGAVQGADGLPNGDDDIDLGQAYEFAESFGPRLVEAELRLAETQGVTAMAADNEVVLTFDRAVTNVTAVRVAAVAADGGRVPVSGCSAEPGIAQDTVICTVPPAPVGEDPRNLAGVMVAFDAVRAAQAWRTGTDPASGFGRGVNMAGLPGAVPLTRD